MVCANLPYLTNAQIRQLPLDIRDYEPNLALSGGPDGLFWYEQLLRQVPAVAAPGATILCEIGPNLRAGFERLVLRSLPTAELHFYPDLAGRTRAAELKLGKIAA